MFQQNFSNFILAMPVLPPYNSVSREVADIQPPEVTGVVQVFQKTAAFWRDVDPSHPNYYQEHKLSSKRQCRNSDTIP